LEKLISSGIKPNAIYGTSVGALNGSGYAYLGMDRLKKIWFGLTKNSDILRFQYGTLILGTRGVYSTAPLKKLITKVVNTPVSSFNALPIVCYTNIGTGEIIYQNPYETAIKPLSFSDAVLASSTIPMVMEPVKDVYVDGGVREITPLKQAIKDGYNVLYVILSSEYRKNITRTKELSNWLCYGYQALVVAMHEIFLNDILLCLSRNNESTRNPDSRYKNIELHIYAPDKVLIDTLEFDKGKISAAYTQGTLSEEVVDPWIIN
jgi:predicted acylesterase/phospholipase RssA